MNKELMLLIIAVGFFAHCCDALSDTAKDCKPDQIAHENAEQQQIWLSFEEIEAKLKNWQAKRADIMKLEVLGETAEGRPLYAVCLTDPDADDEGKEHVLLTANHAGARERMGTSSLMYLIKWLLSDDPSAKEILKRQLVVCMPVGVPDSYVQKIGWQNIHGLSPCNDWTLDGPKDPEKNPEGLAVQKMMDKYQPEVHSDFHGVDMSFQGYIMVENSGASCGNISLRPYHYRIMQLMDEAALKEGYPSDLLEQDAEQQFWGPDLDSISHKLWPGRPQIFAGTYCYNKYHSLILHSEVAWEHSGFLRHRRLLQIGNDIWPGEYYPGYPTRVASKNEFHLVTAYGTTAAARRRSRVELWNKQQQITHGMINPQIEGIAFYVCATSPAAAGKWLKERNLRDFEENIKKHPQINAEPICALISQHDKGVGQWGAQPNLYLTGGDAKKEDVSPIEHGLSLRMRIPYPKARITDLRVNGYPIEVSGNDGYLTWVAKGFKFVQVNISPEKLKKNDLFVVTCKYDPGEKRAQGLWYERQSEKDK